MERSLEGDCYIAEKTLLSLLYPEIYDNNLRSLRRPAEIGFVAFVAFVFRTDDLRFSKELSHDYLFIFRRTTNVKSFFTHWKESN